MDYTIEDIENYVGKDILCIKSICDIYTKGNFYRIHLISEEPIEELKPEEEFKNIIAIGRNDNFFSKFVLSTFNKHFILKTKGDIRRDKIAKILT